MRPDVPALEKASAVLAGGARVLQLRLKRAGVRDAVAVGRAVAERCRGLGAKLLVDDRVDVALACGADGVHLGDDDLAPEDARAVLGPSKIIGVTVRGLGGVLAARAAGADYAGIGPVFPTATKRVDAPPLGLERLAEIARQSPLPLVAISGIALCNIADVARAGVHAAAVVSDLLCAPDIAERARRLSAAFLGASR